MRRRKLNGQLCPRDQRFHQSVNNVNISRMKLHIGIQLFCFVISTYLSIDQKDLYAAQSHAIQFWKNSVDFRFLVTARVDGMVRRHE